MKNKMIDYLENSRHRSIIELNEKWREITSEIPFLKFNSDWSVKIVPPFSGAIIRFLVKKQEDRVVSVYLDFYNTLGCMDEPYWEIYPNTEGDTERYLLNETEELIKAIERAL